jgi:hypothetical protein
MMDYVRFKVLKEASMMFRIIFWDILPCKMIVIPDDGGSTHLWNVVRQSFYTAVYPRRQFWAKYDGLVFHVGELGSSVSIVSRYGLDDRRLRFDPWHRRKDFPSILCVQTGSGAHPASYSVGTGILSPRVKCGRGVTLTTHPHLVPRSRMSRSYTFFHPKHLRGV